MTNYELQYKRVLEDAAQAYHWYQAKVRVCKPPMWPLPLCIRVLRDAHHAGLPDYRDPEAFGRLLEELQ